MRRFLLLIGILPAVMLSTAALAQTPPEQYLFNQLQDYMESAPFGDGVITSQQLKSLKGAPIIVDTRPAEAFAEQHIPSSINIDWRFVLSELKQLPKEKMIVLYCDTGIVSSKAHFALRLIGYEQVKVLFGGYDAWKQEK